MVSHGTALSESTNYKLVTQNNVYNLTFDTSFTPTKPTGGLDYERLSNKPSINNVELIGNKTLQELGLQKIYYDTKNNWDIQLNLIAEQGAFYVYKDYQVIYDEVGNPTDIAGIKIGDGTSFLIDLPFLTDVAVQMLQHHEQNSEIHISNSEREFWNNKVSTFLDSENQETLIFSKDMFEN